MMRKDVRIGLAIGGVLLAVLVVYLLITSAPSQKNQVTLVPDASSPPPPSSIESPGVKTEGSVSPKPVENDPFKPVASGTAAPAAGSAPTTAPADDAWQKAFTTGRVDPPPLLLTETPLPQSDSTQTDAPPQEPASVQANPATPTRGASAAEIVGTVNPGSSPSTQPTYGQRTHVVQRNETFASIAHAVYGNEAYYPHLMRANPNIDAKRLRPGMTIVIPDPAEVVARHSDDPQPASGTTPAPAFDPKREYRVSSGDSLHKIALKLYGRIDKVDAIYELNKDAIGPNRSYLKAGMILKLPEPPTQATAGR